jgi:hypothetical protein
MNTELNNRQDAKNAKVLNAGKKESCFISLASLASWRFVWPFGGQVSVSGQKSPKLHAEEAKSINNPVNLAKNQRLSVGNKRQSMADKRLSEPDQRLFEPEERLFQPDQRLSATDLGSKTVKICHLQSN